MINSRMADIERVKRILFMLIAVFAAVKANPGEGCPTPERFAPCKCSDLSITCNDAKSTEDLAKSFDEEFKDNGVFSVIIVNGSHVQSLPAGIFKSARAETFAITHNNQLNYVSEFAFEGSEETIQTLIINNNQIDDGSVFGAAKRSKNLQYLHMIKNKLASVPDNALEGMEKLETINLQQNLIATIGTRAFANLSNIYMIRLQQNRLTTIGDYAFAFGPRDFYSVQINLRDNELMDFRADSFSGLQKDIRLDLSDNYLSTFPQHVFEHVIDFFLSRVFDRNSIKVDGNQFTCDCNLRWMKNNKYTLDFVTTLTCGNDKKSLSSMKIEEFPEECR